MGNNNVACFLRLRGSLPFPSTLQLGTYAAINIKTSISNRYGDGSYVENTEVLYTVEGSKCKLVLGRTVSGDGNVNPLSFEFHDSIISSDKRDPVLPIGKAGTGLFCLWFTFSIPWTKTRRNVDAWGGVTDTKVYLYGTPNSNGTVAVNKSSETTDIGFSVVTKVGVCDGKFDITVEGPERHPVSALLYMFSEVSRSGIWKPSMCPHCCNNRREHSRMFSQSDSEDDVVPFPPRLGSQQNIATIANDGRFTGHASGSFIRCRNFYGFN
ncbi:uncharacterized protein LOC106772073 isoform X2 [Vigna radiata var. radiata]|uniref:Uncharacterized protein LOC106772073 isoform X2 n=1 Tax=Vigna radiata var. radiata TaxID=3916 RepID=A0A1S3V5U7_VIGRR|nr:uncharacterized protein LOC106772073 isoform X2 [Vigna radiata var. radiata]